MRVKTVNGNTPNGNTPIGTTSYPERSDIEKCMSQGTIPTVLEAMDPNIDWIEPEAPSFPFGGMYRGPQKVIDNVFALL